MREKKRRFLVIGLTLYMLIFSGCAAPGRPEPPEQEEQDEAKIQIGITFDSFLIERWQRDRDVFVSAAQELGAEVNVQNANGSMDEQIKQIDYFISKKMDVIVIICVAMNPEEMVGAVEKAHRAGIPVIAYDRLIPGADVDLYISFDNEEVGRLMAHHMQKHLGYEGTLLQVCGPLEDNNVSLVMDGFAEILGRNTLHIDQTEYAEGWLSETGFTATSAYLAEHDPPDGIMCGNDSIAGQAIRALSERRLAGSVCVVGQDADLDACQRIVEGTQCMTVYKPVEKLARRAAELAVAMADEEAMIVFTEIKNDGIYDVPYENLAPEAVTKENMDEVITGKYHEESDIYLNVRR